jgi:Flp pilus assembly protein TadB
MATCARCAAPRPDAPPQWCKDCERQFDAWVRRHASDIVWHALSGTLIVTCVAVGLPLLGIGKLVAAAGVFAGFGTMYGLARMTRRRRRKQFLQAALPRAYLPVPK